MLVYKCKYNSLKVTEVVNQGLGIHADNIYQVDVERFVSNSIRYPSFNIIAFECIILQPYYHH